MNIRDFIESLRLPFQDDKELRRALRQVIGFYPHDIKYYRQALTHRSSGQRNEKGKPLNNERLEFLGDAMLDAVVGHIVFEHFDHQREGFLTNTRSKLVSRETLGKLAQEMGLTELIQSSGQQRSHNSYMAGNAFEALVGAIYLDQGYNAVVRFMRRRILAQMVNIDKVAFKEVNFKSKLLEWTQKNRVKMDFATTNETTDKNGSPVFAFTVMIEKVEGGHGEGYSKKEAQQMAAKETLQRLRREPQFIDAIFEAKSERTKMEEMPVSVAPDITPESPVKASRKEKPAPKRPEASFAPTADEDSKEATPQSVATPKKKRKEKPAPAATNNDDEFDFSDISATPTDTSREDIIAAAEAAAFANG